MDPAVHLVGNPIVGPGVESMTPARPNTFVEIDNIFFYGHSSTSAEL